MSDSDPQQDKSKTHHTLFPTVLERITERRKILIFKRIGRRFKIPYTYLERKKPVYVKYDTDQKLPIDNRSQWNWKLYLKKLLTREINCQISIFKPASQLWEENNLERGKFPVCALCLEKVQTHNQSVDPVRLDIRPLHVLPKRDQNKAKVIVHFAPKIAVHLLGDNFILEGDGWLS